MSTSDAAREAPLEIAICGDLTEHEAEISETLAVPPGQGVCCISTRPAAAMRLCRWRR
jgi:hypothetical protein